MPRVLDQTVIVDGLKGTGAVCPDGFESLAYMTDYEFPGRSLVSYAAKTYSVLRDDDRFRFEIRQDKPDNGQIILETCFLEKPGLNRGQEGSRKVRRLAYRVFLSGTRASAPIHANISATIEWRPVVDWQHWYPESSSASSLYHDVIEDLKNAILGK